MRLYHGCNGKQKHPSRAAALGGAREGGYLGVQPYLCPSCGCWHAGHSDARSAKADFQGVRNRRGEKFQKY